MTLRLDRRSSQPSAVPQYDSMSFGRYGQKVRVYRLKPGGSFHVEYSDGRERVRRAIRDPRIYDVADARVYGAEFARDLAKGITDRAAGRVPLATILDAYRLFRSPRKSASEQKADKRRAAMFRALWGSRVPSAITLRDWEALIEDRATGRIDSWGRARVTAGTSNLATGRTHQPTVRPRTVQADCLWLRGVLHWATKWRREDGTYLLPENPVRGYPVPQDPSPRRPVASQDRYERLLATITPLEGTRDASGKLVRWPTELRLLLALHNGTGRRLSSILKLRVSDVLWDEGPFGSIRWRSENDKKRREWVVPLNERTRAEIRRYLQACPRAGEVPLVPSRRGTKRGEAPLTRSGADRMLRRAEKLAKLEPLSGSLWHAYRRGWATARKHLPAMDVAAAGGWKDVRTLQTVYQQSDRATLLRVVTEPVELRERR